MLRNRINNLHLYIGLGILAVVLFLELTPWKIDWLLQIQKDEVYKRWSGFVLLGYIAFQLSLLVLRVIGKTKPAKNVYQLHKQLGLLAPLFFLAHSAKLGFGYLFTLSWIYLSIQLVGLLNREFSKIHSKTFNWLWMIVHVGLSITLLIIVSFHIWTAFFYE